MNKNYNKLSNELWDIFSRIAPEYVEEICKIKDNEHESLGIAEQEFVDTVSSCRNVKKNSNDAEIKEILEITKTDRTTFFEDYDIKASYKTNLQVFVLPC